jgi:hypothetical protein
VEFSEEFGTIYSNLKIGPDLTSATALQANEGAVCTHVHRS